jgi:hypothetical protein
LGKVAEESLGSGMFRVKDWAMGEGAHPK